MFYCTCFYFVVSKNIGLNSSQYFIVKIPNERELQQIAFNCSKDIDFKGFMNLYKKCTANPYYFLVIDTILALHNHLRFRSNAFKRI